MVAVYMVVKSLLSNHRLVTDWADILEGSWKVNVLNVIHNIVLLSSTLSTQGALKQASFH